ncbi:MAG: cytochrome c biogenesis protein CcdA [Candidatus Tectomicrobia bacterium]|nr:cytochrome c biogenesis protein CcdA [Candidatus Tectomicrobia bacterium]
MAAPEVSIFLAFAAGFISFISPCVLPLVPSYLSFITGMSHEELMKGATRTHMRLALQHTLAFVLGFSLIFVAFGATATFLGQLLLAYQRALTLGAGIIVIAFGLYISGVLKLKFLMGEKRFHFHNKPSGYIGSTAVGAAFGAGWTPCIGPVLGTILFLAGTQEKLTTGVMLLGAYSLGLAIPFIASAVVTQKAFASFSRIRRYMPLVSAASGVFLIFIGVLMVTNYMTILSSYLLQAFPFLTNLTAV